MARVDNDAVDLEIKVDLNWHILGYQFVDNSSENQYQFLVAFTQGASEWSTASRLTQFDSIVEQFGNSDYKVELAKFLEELADRLKA